MNDVFVFSVIAGVIVALVTLAKFWMDIGATRRTAEAAAASAHEAHQRIDALALAVSDFKTQATREFATTTDIADAERRFAEAVGGMRTDFNNMALRLDNLLAALVTRGQS